MLNIVVATKNVHSNVDIFHISMITIQQFEEKKHRIIYFSNQEAVFGYNRLLMCVFTHIAHKQNQLISTSTTY